MTKYSGKSRYDVGQDMPCLLALVEEREVLVTVLGTLNTNAVKKEG